VVRNTLYHIRVVVEVVRVYQIEINTRGMPRSMTVVSWLTADAVVQVLCLSKRTLPYRKVRIPRSFRSGTHEDEVYHRQFRVWVRKLTGSLLSIVHPCRRISYRPIGTSIQSVRIVILYLCHRVHTLYRNVPMEEHRTFGTRHLIVTLPSMVPIWPKRQMQYSCLSNNKVTMYF